VPREPIVQETGWAAENVGTLTTVFRYRTNISASSSQKRDLNTYFRKYSNARTLPVGYELQKALRFTLQDSEQTQFRRQIMRKIFQIIDNPDHGLITTEINPDLFLPTPRQYIFYHHSNGGYKHHPPHSISYKNLAETTLHERCITFNHLPLRKLRECTSTNWQCIPRKTNYPCLWYTHRRNMVQVYPLAILNDVYPVFPKL
jgi:hypothetical protein